MAKLFDDDPIEESLYYQFVSPDDPPDYLLCLICLSVAKSPQQMDCCGKLYCEECLTCHKRHNTKCPYCRQTGKSFKDRRAEHDIQSLNVKCTNSERGCQWTGKLGNLDTHQPLKCGYSFMPCPKNCIHSDSILRKDLNDHLQNHCPKRQYKCSDCGLSGPYDKITTEHPNECPNGIQRCPNRGCTHTCLRKDWKLHKCVYERVLCKYSSIGCTERRPRKDIEAHENDSVHHLELTTKWVKKLEQEMDVLREENEALAINEEENRKAIEESQEAYTVLYQQVQSYQAQLEQANKKVDEVKQENFQLKTSLQNFAENQNKFTFRLFPFSTHKETDTIFYSEPFYSNLYGYQYNLSIYANGDDKSKGTHVSLYVYLMQGANDDSLVWPFPGTVVVELLNQLEDKNHCVTHINIPPGHEASQRVVSGKYAASGFGYTQFIAQTDLTYKPHSNCQYLKDDMLFFRVSVEVPGSKPWLI